MLAFRPLVRDERGNSLIEMGLALPLLASLLIGMVDISRGVSAKVSAEQAAQRAIEKVQATGDFKTSEESALEADAEAAAGAGSTATVDAWIECNHDGVHVDFDTGSCGGANFARYVKVTVESSFTPIFGTGLFTAHNANGSVNVNGQATVRIQ